MKTSHRVFSILLPLSLVVMIAAPAYAQGDALDDQAPAVMAPMAPGASQAVTAPSPLPIPDASPRVERYGKVMAIVDGATLLLALAEPRALLALPLTGPVLHLASGQSDRAMVSLGLRTVLTIGGALIGYKADRSYGSYDGDDPGLSGLLIGAGVGMISASILDATLLARKKVSRERRFIAPQVNVNGGRVQLGLYGAF